MRTVGASPSIDCLYKQHAFKVLLCLLMFLASTVSTLPTISNVSAVQIHKNVTRAPRSSDRELDYYVKKNESLKLWPYHVLVVLPRYESDNDKYGLTIDKARPVIEIAAENAVASGYQPNEWIDLRYEDSRYWEDATLSERWSVNAVIKAQCEGRLGKKRTLNSLRLVVDRHWTTCISPI